MAILGVITDVGLSTAQDAANDEGFNLVPVSFGVSDQAGVLDPTRTTANAGLFFSAAISSRVIIDQNTIKFVLTIPPGQIPVSTFKIIREIYLYINDQLNNPFLFAIGQPTDEIRYNADDQVTLELEMSITNLDLTSNFVFEFTQATEISEHNSDPAAHTEIIEALRKAGIFLPAGAFPFERRGQHFEDNGGAGVEFDGLKSSVLYNGVTFTSTFNGDELNGLTLDFDGIKTVDDVRAEFNAANYPNTVEHDGAGTEVLPAGTPALGGGSYIVQELDLVYKDTDGVFKQALADGTDKSRVMGIAYRADKLVSTHGVHDIDTGFGIGTPLYLSGTTPGAIVNFDTNINVGLSLGDHMYFGGYPGDIEANVTQEYDAVVSNITGVGQFLTTQEAINFVPSDGRILVDKIEDIKATIDTLGKNLTIVANSPDKGWRRFAGLSSQFQLTFDAIPTQGTFRIEWNFQETNDIAWNASAATIEAEFNLLDGHNGFTVTGDFSTGFTFTSNDLDQYPLPTFVFAGTNEIQRFEFSNVPDDGTITFEHDGNVSLNFPWDDNAADLEIALEALASIDNVTVTGSFASQFFEVEFVGGFLQDGVQEQPLLNVVQSDLDLAGASTDVNGTTVIPIEPIVVQKGKKPASNLFNGTTPITITTTLLQDGEQPGPDTCIIVDGTNTRLGGLGRIENFETGVVLETTADDITVEAHFPGTTKPVETLDKLPGNNYSFDDIQGYAKDVFSQLRISEHPTNKKRVVVSGAEQLLASGITLTQEIDSLLLSFEGAEIDFSTDPIQVFESDGVTPLGADIERPVIAPDQWRWFSINIIPVLTQTDESLKGQILILPASADGATKDLATKPPFGDKPVGIVAIQGALGDKEKTQIVTVKDTFGSLVGKTLILTSKLSDTPGDDETVAFWFTDPSLDTRQVEVDTGVAGVDENLFDSTTNKVLAGRITLVGPEAIDGVNLYLRKIGAPTGSVAVRLLGDNAGEPDFGNVLATGVTPISMGNVPTNYSVPIFVDFGATVNLGAGDYYIEIDGDLYTFSAGNFLAWQAQASATNDLFNRDPAVFAWSTSNPLRTVGYELVQTIKGYPALALTADREVEVTTLVENDLQSTVASKLQAAIDADGAFTASVTTNKVVVENAILGVVTDADMGDTGFFSTVLVQGTDTDATGVEDVSNHDIRQLGVGSGSGAGGDEALSPLARFQIYLDDSEYGAGAVQSFASKEPTNLVDLINSTGKYSIPDKSFNMDSGEKIASLGLIDFANFDDNSSVYQATILSYWKEGFIDPNAIHRISRMGGLAGTFTEVTMEQLASTDVLEGTVEFADEKSYAVVSEQTLNDGNQVDLDPASFQNISQTIVLGAEEDLSYINVYLERLGTFNGKFNIALVADNAGDPDLAGLIVQRGYYDVNTIDEAETLVRLDINQTLVAGTYHVVILTDQSYKTNYVDGVTEIRAITGVDAGLPNYKYFDGAIYTSAGADETLKYNLYSEALILQTIEENPLANNVGNVTLNDTDAQEIAQPLSWTEDRVTLRRVSLEVNKATAGATGVLGVKIIGDNGGVPDLGVLLAQKYFNIDDLAVGVQTLVVDTGDILRSAGTVHLVVETDQAYKDHFNGTPADFVSLRADTSPPIEAGIVVAQKYDGASWTGISNTSVGFLMEGRILDLRLEIESSLTTAKLAAFGVAYQPENAKKIAAAGLPIAYALVQPAVGEVRIDLSSIAPLDPNYLKAYVQDGGGQVFMHPEFAIEGTEVVFAAGVFDVPNAVPLRFEQYTPEIADINPALISLMRENFLGGLVGVDFAFPGRGPKVRADDGIMVEIQVTAAPRTIRIEDQE